MANIPAKITPPTPSTVRNSGGADKMMPAIAMPLPLEERFAAKPNINPSKLKMKIRTADIMTLAIPAVSLA